MRDEIIVTLSSIVFLAHEGLTTWTWSQMRRVWFLFYSHCSLATSCWMICTDMAALHQLHDEELWMAYSNTNVFLSAARYWHILCNVGISPQIWMLWWDVCRCRSKLPRWPLEISSNWTHIAGQILQNTDVGLWNVKFFFSTWKPLQKKIQKIIMCLCQHSWECLQNKKNTGTQLKFVHKNKL